MESIKVVIGANFGDEGKGQMTEYFADKATKEGKSCLVVCHNGTSQRGHTCIMDNGERHIYHHLGSGTAVSADTYFSEDFVVNPIFFREEYNERKRKGFHFQVFVNGKCRIAIPYDIMLNQEIERKREENRHGSCGYGLFEAIVRNREKEFETVVKDAYNLKAFYRKLKNIQHHYLHKRCKFLGIHEGDCDFSDQLSEDAILDVYIDDMKFFLSHTTLADDSILNTYDQVIFEGAQGLLLDMDNNEYFPNLTPSKTGLFNPYNIIKRLNVNCPVEVCYVTRTYVTRHGAGRLIDECAKSDINPEMIDLTNVPNKFQESLRYAKLNVADLRDRIMEDFKTSNHDPWFTCEIAVMHENEFRVEELKHEKYHSFGAGKMDMKEI